MYTDLSYFTCRPELGADATQLFNALTGFSKESRYERLLVAPEGLRPKMTALIDRETKHAREGRPSGIIAKLNAISDAPIVQALYRASQAGVPIDLIVRGMCILRPGIPGISETIRVRSILGRFLEHSRIFAFENGGDRDMYIGSADWMGRNLDRRVETVEPVLDPTIRGQISDILDVFLADNVKARVLRADGSVRTPHAAPRRTAHRRAADVPEALPDGLNRQTSHHHFTPRFQCLTLLRQPLRSRSRNSVTSSTR